MRLLIPLDGSPLAESALGPAAQLARAANESATIILFRCATWTPLAYDVPDARAVTEALDGLREACADYLREVALRPSLEHLTVECRAVTGTPTESIVILAQEEHVDFIVMTSHGRSGLTRTVMGSVAEAVARDAHVPTLILHPETATSMQRQPRPSWNILVPLDGSPLAEDVLPAAASIARAMQGTLQLLMVLIPLEGNIDADRISLHEANTYLAGLQTRLVGLGLSAATTIAWGGASAEILNAATHEGQAADLIAIATHARRGLAHLFWGSVAEYVIRHALCPLLVVHPREEACVTDAELMPSTTTLPPQ